MFIVSFFKHVLHGVALPITVMNSPLYRYPYRQAGEALRSDWLKIGSDIEYVTSNGEARD